MNIIIIGKTKIEGLEEHTYRHPNQTVIWREAHNWGLTVESINLDNNDGILKVPEGIEIIGVESFIDLDSDIKKIILPKSLKVVEERAFYWNRNLDIEINSALTYVGEDAFNGVKKVISNNTIQTMVESAIANIIYPCENIKTIRLNSLVKPEIIELHDLHKYIDLYLEYREYLNDIEIIKILSKLERKLIGELTTENIRKGDISYSKYRDLCRIAEFSEICKALLDCNKDITVRMHAF